MYRGYYIDHVIFSSKADIDAFLRKQSINAYKTACERFAERPSYEAGRYCEELAEHLHKVEGLTWEQIEELELEAIA